MKPAAVLALALVLLAVGFAAGRASAPPRPAPAQQTAPGRYQFLSSPTGLMRVDTVAGTIAQYRAGQWADLLSGLPQP